MVSMWSARKTNGLLAVHVVGLEGVPQEGDVLLLLRALEGERQVVAQFGGFFHLERTGTDAL